MIENEKSVQNKIRKIGYAVAYNMLIRIKK